MRNIMVIVQNLMFLGRVAAIASGAFFATRAAWGPAIFNLLLALQITALLAEDERHG